MTKGNNTTYSIEFIEANRKARRLEKDLQSQFIRDRDIIRDLEQQRDNLQLSVIELKRQIVELQKTQTILKRKMSENEDKYHDTVLDLEARAKKNEDVVLKIGLRAASSVRGPSNRDLSFKNSALSNTKKSSEKVEVSDKTNKKTDITSTNVVLNEKIITNVDVKNALKANDIVQIILWIVDNGCSKHMTGQFCDGDPEVVFNSKTCYVRNLEGDDLLTGARESNLYTIFISDMAASSPICLLSKATSIKSCKDHLCFACERGKSKKTSHLPKLVPSTHFKWELIHMDLCGPMMVASINGKKVSLGRGNSTACFTQNGSIIHTRYNKTSYELLHGRKPNEEYFYVFGSLCYPTNDRDDLGKMKPKADTRIFIGYSKTSKGFQIYNRRTKRIMKTIHVKFDELTAMTSKHDSLEPVSQGFINDDSSAKSINTSSKEDLDNLFGPMYEEYFEKRSSEVSTNSAAQQINNHEDSSLISSIIVKEHKVPPIVTTSEEQTSPISLNDANESNQE
nr:hypothetical protein [Tanacetum cinerariifolium]